MAAAQLSLLEAKMKKRSRVVEQVVEPVVEDPKPELVMVRAPEAHPFWEKHPDHPGGEVWVSGSGDEPSAPVQVALTDAVKRALKEDRLERVSGGQA